MKRIVLLVLVFATACATDSNPATTVAPTAESATTADESTEGAGGGAASIAAADFAFSPSSVTVKVGDSVTWNLTEGAHTATSGTAPAGDGLFNETLDANTPFSFTFAEAGEFQFFCRFHPDFMTGTVIVEP